MTAYNREKYIAQAIESVLFCDYASFELIIVDDCSQDNTCEIIKKYAAKDRRIKFFQNEKNIGDYPNRNKAAGYATGDFITYLDSDDIMLKENLTMYVNYMQQFKNSDFGMYLYGSEQPAFCLSSKEAIDYHFFKKQLLIMGPGGTLMRRSFFEKISGYPESYGPANDMYFNLKAACNSSVVFFPVELSNYRVHDQQESKNQISYMYNNYLYLKYAIQQLKLPLVNEQKEWILRKNKRRFVTNLVKFFIKTKSMALTRQVWKSAEFTFKDAIEGVFHLK